MRTLTRLVFSLLFVAFAIGCGGSSGLTDKQVEDRLMGGTEPSEQEKIKEFLKKAGVEGTVVSIEKGNTNDYWLAEVTIPPAPGKRAMPRPPQGYKVFKSTGKVEKY